MLSNKSVSSDFALSGVQALKMIKDRLLNSKLPQYKIIILDQNMPGMDGATVSLEVQKAYRAFGTAKPFIFCCTAFYSQDFANSTKASEIDSFLSKPLTKAGVDRIIDRLDQN